MQIHADKRCRKHVLCDSGNLDISQSQMNMSANTAGQLLGYLKRRFRSRPLLHHSSGNCLRAAQQTRPAFVVVCYPPSPVTLCLFAITDPRSEAQWGWAGRRHSHRFTLARSSRHCAALIRRIQRPTRCESAAPSSQKHCVAHSSSFHRQQDAFQTWEADSDSDVVNSGCCCWILLIWLSRVWGECERLNFAEPFPNYFFLQHRSLFLVCLVHPQPEGSPVLRYGTKT